MLKRIPIAFAILAGVSAHAETVKVTEFSDLKSLPLTDYIALGDTAGLSKSINPLKLAVNEKGLLSASENKTQSSSKSLKLASAAFDNRRFTEAEIAVDGIDDYVIYLDEKETSVGKVKLHPGSHKITIKYVDNEGSATPELSVTTPSDGIISLRTDGTRLFSLSDILYGKNIRGAKISPSGSYALITYSDTREGGKSDYSQKLFDIKKGTFVGNMPVGAQWMSKSEAYIVERNDYENGRHLVKVNPVNGEETILATNLPEGSYAISPTEDFLIFNLVREGAKEDPEIYRVIEPEDRQPGWRDRTYPAIYRFDNPVLQPLALNKNSLYLSDIADDGTKLLLMSSSRRITERPTTLFSLITLDLTNMKADTIVANDGFISEAYFTPDAQKVVVTGSPEAFGRVGCTLPADVIPNMYDYQLYMVDVNSKRVTPLTRDFNPSVSSSIYNRYDDKIYILATDRDMMNVYALDPVNCSTTQLSLPENVVMGMDCAESSPIMMIWGQSDSAPNSVYTYNIKTCKTSVVDQPSAHRLADISLGECKDWTFKNPNEETVYARYYLPDNFDPNKKYPLIVNYYGGCTPSTRYFDSRYPMHLYASLGYVTLVINPSGATGFGQEWSSRHVSTAGQGVAEDIIAGTKQFCVEMPFVDADKIGCVGASYGGFMTQYLQTVTDIFAAAVSHAGISDHTSYWGEGYWGYSYSEVSMGEDLPWTNPDLYVKQSPLYNADKINTPILFVHGDADTNVPVGESIQMFTALQRLGKESALVQVSDQNHHILDYSKRQKWQDTILAWFAKYLQDDPTWWNEFYPDPNL